MVCQGGLLQWATVRVARSVVVGVNEVELVDDSEGIGNDGLESAMRLTLEFVVFGLQLEGSNELVVHSLEGVGDGNIGSDASNPTLILLHEGQAIIREDALNLRVADWVKDVSCEVTIAISEHQVAAKGNCLPREGTAVVVRSPPSRNPVERDGSPMTVYHPQIVLWNRVTEVRRTWRRCCRWGFS